MNYCMYLRKSRADREAEARGEGETLARHEHMLMELASKLHISITQIYREVVSGETIASRPIMTHLLEEVEKGLWNGVLVVEVERLARGDTIDQGIMAQAFKFSNTKIITPSKTYDPNNEFDEEYFEFGLFMSRREYKTINRRLQNGRLASIKEGKYVGNKRPYGYNRVKLKHDKGFTLEIVPDEAKVVQLIFSLYAYGDDSGECGVARIVRKLNNMKVPTINGGDWTTATIQSMLNNPVYIGKIGWGRRKTVKSVKDGVIAKTRPRNKTDITVFEGLHPPIVSEKVYNDVQIKRQKNPPRPINNLHLIKNPLSGLVVCAKCGRKMVRRPYQKRGQLDSLICPYTSCDNVSSTLASVEQDVLSGLNDILIEYKTNPDIVMQRKQNNIDTLYSSLEYNNNELNRLENQKTRLYDLLEQGIYSTDVFLERSSSLAKQIDDVTAAIENINTDIEKAKQIEDKEKLFIPKCEHLLKHYNNMDIAEKNNLLKEIIEKVVYLKESKNTRGNPNQYKANIKIFPKL